MWLNLPESREEVLNGEMRPMASPTWKHCDIADNIRDLILDQVAKKLVRETTTQFDLVVRLDSLTARVLSPANSDVLSPANSRREREQKPADSAAVGRSFRHRRHLAGVTQLKPASTSRVQLGIQEIWPQ